MKLTVEVRTSKTFDIDSEIFQQVEKLNGYEAFDKIVEIIGGWNDEYDTNTWDDSDKLELLEENCDCFSRTEIIQDISYEQRYKVYDFHRYKTLFYGNIEKCTDFLVKNPPAHENVKITEY